MDSEFAVLKQFWNLESTGEQLSEAIIQQYSKEEIISLAFCLFNWIKKGIELPNHFIECLSILFIKYRYEIIASTPLDDENRVSLLLHFFIKAGENLFNDFHIGTKSNARFSLTISEICLSGSNKLASHAIISLSSLPFFPTLISSGRIFDRSNFYRTRSIFIKKRPFDDCNLIRTQALELFFRALLAERVVRVEIMRFRQDLNDLIDSMIQMMRIRKNACNIYNINLLMNFLSNSVIKFQNDNSVHRAFLNNLIVEAVYNELQDHFGRETPKMANSEIQRFIDENFADLHQSALPVNESHIKIVFEHWYDDYLYKNMNIQIPKSIYDLIDDIDINYYAKIPTKIDESRIFEEVSRFPSLSVALSQLIMMKASIKTIKSFSSICRQALEIFDDFRPFIYQSDTFSQLILKMSELIPLIIDETDFEYIWILFLSLIKFTYGIGSKVANEEIISCVDSMEASVKSFVLFFLNIDKEQIMIQILKRMLLKNKPVLPFDRCINILATTSHKDICKELEGKSYLFPTILASMLNNRVYFQIPKFKDYKLLNAMFFSILVSVSSNTQEKWKQFLKFPDYDMFVAFPPASLHDTEYFVIDSLQSKDFRKYQTLVIAFRAWLHVFGSKTFVRFVFDTLKTLHMKPSLSESLVHHPNLLFWIFGVIFMEVNESKNPLFLEMMRDFVDIFKNENYEQCGDQFGSLFVGAILGADLDIEEIRLFILEIISEFYHQEASVESRGWILSLSFVKSAVCFDLLIPLLPIETIEILVDDVDYPELIDFFISKGEQLSQRNKEDIPDNIIIENSILKRSEFPPTSCELRQQVEKKNVIF